MLRYKSCIRNMPSSDILTLRDLLLKVIVNAFGVIPIILLIAFLTTWSEKR